MIEKTIDFQVGKSKSRVRLIAIPTRNGIVVSIIGGEKTHVGAVAVAIPRPSLRDPSIQSATSSVLTMPSHKDDEVARPASEKIAKTLNQVAVVVAGLHIDDASEKEIRDLSTNAEKAVDRLLAKFSTVRSSKNQNINEK